MATRRILATRTHIPAAILIVGGVVIRTSAVITECSNRLTMLSAPDATPCEKCADLRALKIARSTDPELSGVRRG